MGMKLLPAVATFTCAALLISCGHKAAVTPADKDRQDEEYMARQQRQMLEREAALDERERLLVEREHKLGLTATTPSGAATAPAPGAELPPQAAAAPPAVSSDTSYQTFYDDLAPFGSWIDMTGYGYVWQPAEEAQDPKWRPYNLGHWVYTDQGWAWVSDEPFGWITYHYGRWMRTHNAGWVWTPGDEWAPAWVSWRYGNDFVGWAPLPPEARFDETTGIQQWADQQYNLGPADYTFVPASDFGDDNMAEVDVPPDQTGPIYEESNNITNEYYDSGSGDIICLGPTYEFMRSKCRRPLPPEFHLRRAGYVAGGTNKPSVSGTNIQITGPRIVHGNRPTGPRIIRGRIADGRVVAPPAPPRPVGSAIPPLYHPPERAAASPDGGMQFPSAMNPSPTPAMGMKGMPGMQIPSRMNPIQRGNNPAPIQQGNPGNGPANSTGNATGVREPSQVNPAPAPGGGAGQKQRELQAAELQRQQEAAALAIQRQQEARAAEVRRAEEAAAQRAKVAEAAAAAQRAMEAVASERAGSDKAAPDRAAAEQHESSGHASPTGRVPTTANP